MRFTAEPEVPDAALIGTNWALDTVIEGDAASTPASPASLTFTEDGAVTGSTGCNNLFGTYSAAYGFSEIGSTKMACEDPIMAQEALFFEILNANASVTIEGNLLTIADLEGRALVYRVEGG